MIAMVARFALDGESFGQLEAIGNEMANRIHRALRNDPSMMRPWNHKLQYPIVVFCEKTKRLNKIVPTIFTRDRKYLLAEIRDPHDCEINFGLVVWSRERKSSYIRYGVAEMLEYCTMLNTQVKVLAYAMPSDEEEIVLSDTYGGLVRMLLHEDNDLHGTTEYIKDRRRHTSENWNVDCLVFTDDCTKLITGNRRGHIEVRSRIDYLLLAQFQMEPDPHLTCMAIGRNDTQLALARLRGPIELWDLQSGTRTAEIRVGFGHRRRPVLMVMSHLQYSQDNQHLLALTTQGNIFFPIDRRFKIWHYQFETGNQSFSAIGVEDDPTRIYRAGFLDNAQSWTVTATTLRYWNVADGTSAGGDRSYDTLEDFAISDDRSIVAYLSRNYDWNISDDEQGECTNWRYRPIIVDHFCASIPT